MENNIIQVTIELPFQMPLKSKIVPVTLRKRYDMSRVTIEDIMPALSEEVIKMYNFHKFNNIEDNKRYE